MLKCICTLNHAEKMALSRLLAAVSSTAVLGSPPCSIVANKTNVREKHGGSLLLSHKKGSWTATQSVAPTATNNHATADGLVTAANSAETGYRCTGLADASHKLSFLAPSGLQERDFSVVVEMCRVAGVMYRAHSKSQPHFTAIQIERASV